MKISLILFAGLLSATSVSQVCGQSRRLAAGDLYIRDPFVVADAQKGIYYMYGSRSQAGREGETRGGVAVYKSRDLKTWEGPQQVFTVPEDNWITGAVWAPEVHRYNGRCYLFATLNSDIEWKKKQAGWPAYTFRGTQIFHADTPEGPFLPFDRVPHTPPDWMALDGTLWVEDGTPWMVFCHEWIQMTDGTMEAVQLKPDLSAPAGRPLRLFCASSAPWAPEGRESYVTDGCFIYRTRSGKLLMIWSGFSDKGYAIGIAESVTGKITGPWKQQPEPLFNQDGGHGMIFRTFDGKLCLAFHRPNGGGAERAHFLELEDTGETLTVKQELK
ncbi:MAG: glycoside hydrolase family 43 protein [Tannerella sp.]|jgi:beta-xylosidase|nr:glycoside hydrolase family 43 protein [Tannerella sp.]